MNIKVIFTGGTIGSRVCGDTIGVSGNAASQLIQLFHARHPDCGVSFSEETLMGVLSENMSIPDWRRIYDRISAIAKSDCDGVILTHGTDTLAYTAAFLALMLKGFELPVLLVSADYPLDDARSNGLPNFAAAVEFIAGEGTKGVFVPFYKNTDGMSPQTVIHLGSRLMQAHPFVHTFSSLGNVPYGYMSGGQFTRFECTGNPTVAEIERESPMPVPHFPRERRILHLAPYPGMDYDMLDLAQRPDAILHGLFHSGTACAAPEHGRNSVVAFARRCIARGTDFYAAPCDSRGGMYSSAREMADAGVRFISDVSVEAAYAKLLIAYGAFETEEERARFLNLNIACEKYM